MFGCISHVHNPSDEQEKLDSKSKKCILLGSGSTTKGYHLYDLLTKKVQYSRNVIFDETQSVSSEKESSSNESSCRPEYIEVPVVQSEEDEESTDPEMN